MNTIGLPIDFSKVSGFAVDFAIDLAKKNGHRLSLIHALDFPIPMQDLYVTPTLMNEILEESKKSSERELQRVERRIKSDDIESRIIVLQRPLSEVISTIQESEVLDLIIMGTTGASGIKEVFIGSNTEKVIRNSRCPVLSMHRPTDINSLKTILVPTTTEHLNKKFMEMLRSFSASIEADKIHFLHVQTPNGAINESLFNEKVLALTTESGIQNFEVMHIRDFNEEDGISSYSSEIGADIICMATHGRKGIGHFLSGSLAENLANHLELPILTYNLKANSPLYAD